MAAPPQLSYAVPPHEQAYYEGLFQAADRSRAGVIGGGEAVPFFSLSKLTVDTLKNIWTLSDQPPANSLDRRKFAVAIRLIQLAQNGVKAQGAQLQGPPGMRPAMFEGVSGVSVQFPPPEGPPQQQQQQQPYAPPQQQQQPPPQQQQQPPPQQQQFAPPPQQQQQQQPPPPQQQQQYAQPPPQQQQYAQPPHPQQQQRAPTPTTQYASQPQQPLSPTRHPPTPPRPPMGGVPPAFSMALTPQDPYTMTPQEQARYEGLFPNYAGPDGFVHGKEAVELFSKSNIPQDQLGAIWNLVDSPVDNKLDKLEFAMAMHLIVCVSKKNLPTPSALPISLKILKSQQPGNMPGAQPPMSQEAPPLAAPTPILSPQRQQFVDPPPSQPQMHYNAPPQVHQQQYSAPPSPSPRYSTPPPLQPPGGGAMAISDAFEGLTPATAAQGYDEPVSFDPPPAMPSMGYSMAAPASIPEPHHETIPEPKYVPQPSYSPAPAPIPPPKSTEQLASSYRMGDDSEELKKLKATLQRLQAENIALRAQMGSMTEEERDVQREAMATIAEINRLSNELTEVRAQVLSSKTRLLESSAELAAAKEKKTVMSDLIYEAKATKEVMEVASNDLHTVAEKLQAAPAPPPAPVAEEDLFGGWGAPAPAASWGTSTGGLEPLSSGDDDGGYHPPVQQFQQQMAVSTSSYDSGDGFVATAPAPAPNNAAPVANQAYGQPHSAAPAAIQAYGQDPLASSAATRDGIENAKRAALAAETKAREADETYRALSQETESLRKVSDAAEAEAMAKQEKASSKKFGKKKLMKEAEEASIEAANKKKHFLEMQAQTSNAQSLAAASRKEADKLRNFAEQAELDFASAESAKDSGPSSNGQAWGIPDPPAQSYPNYGIDQSKASSAFGSNQGYGNSSMPVHMVMQPNVSQASDDSHSFGGAIMGGGSGLSIPTPSAANDYNYNNPF